MNCPRCHRPIPDNQLACGCFAAFAAQERYSLAMRRFQAEEAPIYLVELKAHNVRKHLSVERGDSVTLCGEPARAQRQALGLTPQQVCDVEHLCPTCKLKALHGWKSGAAIAGGGGDES